MTDRLTRIYTRTGDDGTTGTADGRRLHKDAAQIVANGDVDELNSSIAIVVCQVDGEHADMLRSIQDRLFDAGAELSMTGQGAVFIKPQHVVQLERWIDDMNAQLPPLREFILPGGSAPAAACHLARAVCRRAERSLITLSRSADISSDLPAYLNRLSDLLFVLARDINRRLGVEEVFWNK